MLFITKLALVFCVLTVVISLLCSYIYFQNKYIHPDPTCAISIVKLIESLGNLCPLSPTTKWDLLSHDLGTPRCWHAKLPFKILSKTLDIYGTSVLVEAHSLSVFKTIANPNSWAEWIPCLKKTFSTKLFINPLLKGDAFMRTAQIVNQFNDIESFRFSHLGTNKLGWILFWDIKKIQMNFFLIQPSKKYEKDQCLLTHIYGCFPKSNVKSIVRQIIISVSNVKEASELISAKVVPFQLVNDSVSNSNSSAEVFADDESDVKPKTQRRKSRKQSGEKSKFLSLLPYYQFFTSSAKKLIKFELSSFDSLPNDFQESESIPPKNLCAVKELKKKNLHVQFLENVVTSSEPSTSKHQNSSMKSLRQRISSPVNNNNINDKVKEITVTAKNSHASSCSQVTQNIAQPLDNLENASDVHPLSENTLSENIAEKSKIEDTSSTDPEQDVCDTSNELLDDGEQYVGTKSTSDDKDFEILFPHAISRNQMADIKTKGNYCASVLQVEIMDAFSVNLQSAIEDKSVSNAGWLFHSHTKGITVLSKQSNIESFKILSFACELELPVKSDRVWNLIKNPRSRFICDDSVKKVDILEDVSSGQKIIYVYHEINYLLKKEAVDFCLLHTERIENSKCYLSFCSFEYKNCPLMEGTVRGSMVPSGFVVEPTGLFGEMTNLKFLYQIMASSSSSAFVPELSSCVPQYLINLKNYLLSGPK